MANELTIFDQGKSALPAHVVKLFQEESNITERVTVPTLSYEGKVWTIGLDGNKTRLMRKNAEGDEEPVSVMRVVILDYAKQRGRTYYEGAYDPAKIASPTCWSDDGVKPAATLQAPQSAKCDGCPMSVKGSKITEQGKGISACSQHRMVAVVPASAKPDADRLSFSALRMKLAITSLWDKTSDDLVKENWRAFDNYTDFMRANGVQHTAALVTKMRFDPNVAYPKVIFSPDRWLSEEELAVIAPRLKGDDIPALLAGTWTPAGIDGVKVSEDADDEGLARRVEAAIEAKAKTEAAAEDAAMKVAAAKAKAATEAQAKKAAEAAAKKDAPADDDDGEIILPGKAAAPAANAATAKKTAPAAATVSTEVPEDLAALLGEWDED